jgi:hypothetical protein
VIVSDFAELPYKPFLGYTIASFVKKDEPAYGHKYQFLIHPSQNPKDKFKKEARALENAEGWLKYEMSIDYQYLTKRQAEIFYIMTKYSYTRRVVAARVRLLKRYPNDPFLAEAMDGVYNCDKYWYSCLRLAWRRYSIFINDRQGTVPNPTPCNKNPRFEPYADKAFLTVTGYEEFRLPFWHYVSEWEMARKAAPCQVKDRDKEDFEGDYKIIKDMHHQMLFDRPFMWLLDLYNSQIVALDKQLDGKREDGVKYNRGAEQTQEFYFRCLESSHYKDICWD